MKIQINFPIFILFLIFLFTCVNCSIIGGIIDDHSKRSLVQRLRKRSLSPGTDPVKMRSAFRHIRHGVRSCYSKFMTSCVGDPMVFDGDNEFDSHQETVRPDSSEISSPSHERSLTNFSPRASEYISDDSGALMSVSDHDYEYQDEDVEADRNFYEHQSRDILSHPTSVSTDYNSEYSQARPKYDSDETLDFAKADPSKSIEDEWDRNMNLETGSNDHIIPHMQDSSINSETALPFNRFSSFEHVPGNYETDINSLSRKRKFSPTSGQAVSGEIANYFESPIGWEQYKHQRSSAAPIFEDKYILVEMNGSSKQISVFVNFEQYHAVFHSWGYRCFTFFCDYGESTDPYYDPRRIDMKLMIGYEGKWRQWRNERVLIPRKPALVDRISEKFVYASTFNVEPLLDHNIDEVLIELRIRSFKFHSAKVGLRIQ